MFVYNVLRTLGVLTMLHFGPPFPHNPAVYDLTVMVKELGSHNICGFGRTKLWMAWYLGTARSVFECFPTIKVKDMRDGLGLDGAAWRGV